MYQNNVDDFQFSILGKLKLNKNGIMNNFIKIYTKKIV